MSHVEPSTIINQLKWRYATKVFDPTKKISAANWAALEASLINAPSSYGLQPWRFVVVTTQSVKDRLPAAAWNQSQPKDCSHFVVIAARKVTDAAFVQKFVESIAAQRGVPLDSLDGYKQLMLDKAGRNPSGNLEWNARQCYIALGMLLQSAALMEIDACPMEGIIPASMDEILGLSGSDYTAVVGCALGYRAADDSYAALKKVRFAAGEVVQHL